MNKIFYPYILFIIVFLSGCSSLQSGPSTVWGRKELNEFSKGSNLHQIYIGSDGELKDAETGSVIYGNDAEDIFIDKIFAKFEEINNRRLDERLSKLELTIFIHGGLNSFENATERVTRDTQQMLNEGKYPVFISWDSGFPGNYRDHLFLLNRGIRSPTKGILFSPFTFLLDLTRSIIHIPESTYNVIVGQMALHNKIDSEAERNSRQELQKLTDFHIAPHENRNGHPFFDDAMKVNPTKLFTAPLIDGLGTGAWNSMMRRTDLVLRRNADFTGASERGEERGPQDLHALGTTAAAKFLRRWELKYKVANDNPKVTLIGHSMGTIIANSIVAKYPDICFTNIVYMAAATTMKDIEEKVAVYLRKNNGSANCEAKFYNLSLHPERDLNEAHFFDTIPRGSLLVWIDQTLAYINSFQTRTAGFWYNMVLGANQIFTDVSTRKRVYLTRFGVRDGSPQSHGDFGKCAFWREEFWTFNSYDGDKQTEELKCDHYFPRTKNLPILD